MDKTNVMRLLDAAKIEYVEKTYDAELTDGESIAKILGEDPECVLKTLVTVSDKKEYFVFCVPVNGTLNLKEAAKAVGAKSIAMIHQKELLPLTGYVHGGCSPIGLKKPFPVTIDETAQLFDRVYVS
ncbi:MAG: aminoacyl-tRNA deacylase, partial [Bacilli bacterium]|nr:aminoacyl-tRNA deacylase [Bacilli bacterium]